MSAFKLEARHLRNGINDNDFAEYSGFRVVSNYLSEFPNWKKLSQFKNLTDAEIQLRVQNISKWAASNQMPTLPKNSINELANQIQPMTLMWYGPPIGRDKSIKYYRTNMPNLIHTEEKKASRNVVGKHKTGPTLLFPFGFCEEYPVNEIVVPTKAIMLRSPGDNYRSEISRMTEIQKDRILNRSHENLLSLLQDLHEAAHWKQVDIRSSWIIASYYAEVSADLNASTAFKRVGIGKETIKQDRYARYINSLYTGPDYLVGPALDALESNTAPPDFWKVFSATIEIRFRLAMEALSKPHKHIKSSELQEQITTAFRDESFLSTPIRLSRNESALMDEHFIETFTTCIRQAIHKEPESVYTLLKKIQKSNVITDRIACQILRKIVEAAEYFCGKDITHEPRARQKIQAYTSHLDVLLPV